MRLFRKRIGPLNDPLAERADALVDMTNAAAIGAYMPLFNQFPVFKGVSEKHFDFFFTIAGIHIAMVLLKEENYPPDREGRLMDRVAKGLSAWNSEQGISAIQDCKSFFDRTAAELERAGIDLKFIAADTIGAWVAWNILDRLPETEEEQRLSRTIGTMVIHGLRDWWKE